MSYGWKGKLVRLVPLDIDKHLDAVTRWMNDPEVTETLGFRESPMSLADEKDFIDRMSKASQTDVVWAIETLDGRHVGTSGIHQIDLFHGTGTTGSYIGEPSDWGKGFGSEAAAIRAFYAFEVLNLRMLTTCYLEGNDRSRRMSEKQGFVEYSVLPAAAWRHGRYWTRRSMYCTKEMWIAATGGVDPTQK